MKYDPLKINIEKYESTCSIVFNTQGKQISGPYLKVNLCDIMFMERYHDVLLSIFSAFGDGEIDSILQFDLYVITDPGRIPLFIGQRISPKEYARYLKYDMGLVAKTGARALYELLGEESLVSMIDRNEAGSDKQEKVLKDFICESGQESPRSVFRRYYYIPLLDYDENEGVMTIASGGRNDKLIEVMHKNQFLWDCIEEDAGSVLIAQGRRSLKEAFDKVNFSIPVVDEMSDMAVFDTKMR